MVRFNSFHSSRSSPSKFVFVIVLPPTSNPIKFDPPKSKPMNSHPLKSALLKSEFANVHPKMELTLKSAPVKLEFLKSLPKKDDQLKYASAKLEEAKSSPVDRKNCRKKSEICTTSTPKLIKMMLKCQAAQAFSTCMLC